MIVYYLIWIQFIYYHLKADVIKEKILMLNRLAYRKSQQSDSLKHIKIVNLPQSLIINNAPNILRAIYQNRHLLHNVSPKI